MRDCLITGGAGFVGGALALALAQRGHRVDLVDNLARGREDRFLRELQERHGVRLFRRDLCDAAALADLGRGYGRIFHLAAILGVRNVLAQPYRTLRDNARLLESALDFAQAQDALDRFVFASTSEVYAGSLGLLDVAFPTPEETPLAVPDLGRPRASYMLSKIHGEALVRHAGLRFTIVRPHNVYGPRMGRLHVVPELLEKAHHAREGEAVEVFSVDHRRTFCFVDDAVEMLIRASEADAADGLTLNLGSEAPEISIGALAEEIFRVVGKRLRVDARPATPGSPVRRCPAMARMTAVTGTVANVSLEEGLRRTYEWYRTMVFDGEEPEVAR